MERRDEQPLDGEAQAEADLRRLLARYGQPAPVCPPADLAVRVLQALPAETPRQIAWRRRIRRLAVLLAGLLAALLATLGAWSVLVDSTLLEPASAGVGRALLLLALLAKPLVGLLLSGGLIGGVLWLAALVLVLGLWGRVVRPVLDPGLAGGVP